MVLLLHPVFGRKIQWAILATKWTLRGEAGSRSGLWRGCRTQLSHPFPPICTAFLRGGWTSPAVAGNPTARVILLWIQSFMCPLQTPTKVYFIKHHSLKNFKALTNFTICVKSWMLLAISSITAVILLAGKREERAMQQEFLSNQCCNLEYTDLHTLNGSSPWLLATTL